MTNALVGHLFVGDTKPAAALYDYVCAGNGVFIRAANNWLRVQFQIGYCEIRGLPELEETYEFSGPLVPVEVVTGMMRIARQHAFEDREVLFHLVTEGNGFLDIRDLAEPWQLVVPEQEAGSVYCKPLDSGPDSSHARAVIECHSHHSMSADFSGMDDEAQKGFRIYAVVGRVLTSPEIRVRVGCHGYFWEIPAEWVFEMPQALRDCSGEVDDDESENRE